MRIYVAGSTGMVGKNICEHIDSKRHTILSTNRDQLDLTNRDDLKYWLNDNKPELIINAAGLVGGIHANIANPSKFLINNLEIGLNLVSEGAKAGIKNIINLGSSCMYPRDYPNPLRENSLFKGNLEPTNEGYALAKIAIHRLCSYLKSEDNSRNFVTLMPCNLYGKYDHFEDSRSHLIASIIVKLHNAKITNTDQVVIWGDGSARREFMFAKDIASAIWFILPSIKDLPEVINIGPGNDRSILNYYQEAANVIGYKGEFVFDLSKPVGMKQKLLDVNKINKLGWKPEYDLRKGLEITYDHYLKTLNENG